MKHGGRPEAGSPAEARTAGVLMHISSLPGAHGIGDIASSATSFLDLMEHLGLRVWQFLPTGPTGFGDSPYQALSTFAGNELLLGLEPLIEQGLLRAADSQDLESLPRDYVDFGALIPRKQALLQQAAGRYKAVGGESAAPFEEFLHRSDRRWLHDYALYRVLKSLHGGKPWPDWDEEFARRDSGALQQVQNRHREEIDRVKIVQFLFDQQWRTLKIHAGQAGIRLFGDMPIYLALDSADAWANPALLQIGEDGRPARIAGVPPDYFSADGQLWGNPLYDWDFHAGDGFAWWIDRARHATRMSDLVRVDHFRGFESYWSVPLGSETARAGRWEAGPGDTLFRAIENALGGLPIVAEDLGLITRQVTDLRRRHGIPGMEVLQFALGDADFDLSRIEDDCVCYTGTHDNDTTRGWFAAGDEDLRPPEEIVAARKRTLAITGGKAATIHRDLIRLAFSSPARLAIAPLQDFLGLGSEARMNRPGTSSNNWRWRVLGEQLKRNRLDYLPDMVTASSRG
jgi:4-alpha-glucanotransferase